MRTGFREIPREVLEFRDKRCIPRFSRISRKTDSPKLRVTLNGRQTLAFSHRLMACKSRGLAFQGPYRAF